MAYHTIKIKKYSDVIEELTSTAVALTPGMLLEVITGGYVRKHAASEGDITPPMFALEDELQGRGIDDDYAASSKIQVWIPGRGDRVYALLQNGQSVVAGDRLASGGDGTLIKYVSVNGSVKSNQIVAIAMEAVDMSGSAGADPGGRIDVMII